MSGILDWTHATAAVGANGLAIDRSATTDELRSAADSLGVLALARLDVDYRITQLSRARFRLRGELTARVVQACVVALDPVTADLVEPFDVEFWPADAVEAVKHKPKSVDQSVLDDDEPERIEDNAIDVGRIVYETLAAAIDPYPRSAGATLEVPEDHAATSAAVSHPFAVLANLKRDQK